MVDCTCLENRSLGNRTVSSNLTSSAFKRILIFMSNTHIKWKAHTYQATIKSVDWYWGLGLITFVSAYFAYKFDTPIFSILLISLGISIAVAAKTKDENDEYEITSKGVRSGNTEYSFDSIKSFYIFEGSDHNTSSLLLNTKDSFLNHVSIPLGNADISHIKDIMRRHVLEKKQTPTIVDAVMRWLKI